MVTLGIGLSHDGTISVVKDGVHKFSLGEERINRIKAYIGFPFKALREAIKAGHVIPEEIDVVAIPIAQFPYKAAKMFAFITTEEKQYYDLQNENAPANFSLPKDGWESLKSDQDCHLYVRSKLRSILQSFGIRAPIEFHEHHLTHAASAYCSSGLKGSLGHNHGWRR